MEALSIIANKMEYQSVSDLEPLLKFFSLSKDKEALRAMFESTTVNLEESPLEQNLKHSSTSEMVPPVVQQQAAPQKASRQQLATPQPEVDAFNFAQFKKKLTAAKSVDEKLEVMESESGATLTVKEVQTIAMTLSKDADRVRAIEILSRYVESFAVSDVTLLIAKISDIDVKLKVIEALSHKLVYALPWDCEPIYKVLPAPEKKTMAREILASVQGSSLIEPSIPTTEMLIKAVTTCSFEVEKMNILRSWLASVPNPVLSPEELTKLIKNCKSDEQRLEVLPEVSKFAETFNAEQMLGLMKVFTTVAARLSALPAIANKLVYHFDTELETLHKVLPSITDKEVAYPIIESMSVKQQGEFPPGEPNIPDLIKRSIELLKLLKNIASLIPMFSLLLTLF
ncbi:hypothetical protein GEMRC1_005571 [Eukaryota sp. GEM-RC1]